MANSEGGVPNDAAMATIWVRLNLFLAGVALGWLGLEVVLLHTPNSMVVKRQRLEAIAQQVDTLILGSSETYYGLSPHALSGTAYNLASNAQSLYYDFQLTKKYLPQLPELKRAILLVNYMSLYSELYDHPEEHRQYAYLQEWGLPLQRPVDLLDPRSISRVLVHSPHVALKSLADGFQSGTVDRIDDRGWYRVPDEDRWGLSMEDAAERLKVHHGFMRESHLPANLNQLRQLIELLQGRNVEVVLLTTPVFPTYQAQMRPDLWTQAHGHYVRLADEYGIRYSNFQNEPRLGPEDFEDADHLNADGAARFAHLLDAAMGPLGDLEAANASDQDTATR